MECLETREGMQVLLIEEFRFQTGGVRPSAAFLFAFRALVQTEMRGERPP